jgi:hypothetical protein
MTPCILEDCRGLHDSEAVRFRFEPGNRFSWDVTLFFRTRINFVRFASASQRLFCLLCCSTGQRSRPASLPPLYSWLTCCGWHRNRYLCRWHSRPHHPRRSSNSNAQTANCLTRNSTMAKKMAYESQWNKVNPRYFYLNKVSVSICPTK